MTHISSLQNPEIKHLVALKEAKERKEYGQFIAQGTRVTSTLLEGKIELIKLYVLEDQIQSALSFALQNQIVSVSDSVMTKISPTVSTSGIVGLFAIPPKPSKEKLTAGLVLAQVSDPGNVGALIRTAVACGIKSVVIIDGADPWSPKAVHASAGTISWVEIFELDWQMLLDNKKELQLCALVVQGGVLPSQLEAKKSLIIVGNEAHGLPQEWQQSCDKLVSLPMPGRTESLNAAAAGSIALYLTFVYETASP